MDVECDLESKLRPGMFVICFDTDQDPPSSGESSLEGSVVSNDVQ